jgi:hypothetical protein
VNQVLRGHLSVVVANQQHPAGAFQVHIASRGLAGFRHRFDPLLGIRQVKFDALGDPQSIGGHSEIECHLTMYRAASGTYFSVPLPRLGCFAESQSENDAEQDDSHFTSESTPTMQWLRYL